MRKHATQLNTIAEPIKTAMNNPEILKDMNGFSFILHTMVNYTSFHLNIN